MFSQSAKSHAFFWYSGLSCALLLLAGFSLGIGRYPVPLGTVFDILSGYVFPGPHHWTDVESMVVLQLRLPRVLAAVIVGMALAMAGATLQGVFRNPLVDSHIIGITGGASFGGVLALFLGLPVAGVVTGSFGAGMLATVIVFTLSRAGGFGSLMALVLSGLIVGAFFSALVSLIVFLSDPDMQLPGIVYWLMGSFARVDYPKLIMLAVPTFVAGLLLYRMRWRINILSLGDSDAAALGVNVVRTRWTMLALVSLMVGAQVSVSGGIGWIGLVVPHLARMLTGPDHKTLLPTSALLGGVFTLVVDNLARTLTQQELPVGLLSALIGTPVFAYLYWRRQSGWHGGGTP